MQKPNPSDVRGVDLSRKLMERENAEAIKEANEKIAAYKNRLDSIVSQVTDILTSNDVTLQEFQEIIKVFGDRNVAYLNKVRISSINNKEYAHEQPRTNPGEKTV